MLHYFQLLLKVIQYSSLENLNIISWSRIYYTFRKITGTRKTKLINFKKTVKGVEGYFGDSANDKGWGSLNWRL